MSAKQAEGSLATHSTHPIRDGIAARRSHSKVTDEAPSTAELEEILSTMNAVADHSALRPWRIIELRGGARKKLGKALAKAADGDRDKYITKAQRSPLVLAVVVSPRKSGKVPYWEQEAVASGVAHYLILLLQEAGWGSMWRTGTLARSKPVRKAHKLEKGEQLLGWIYVGGIPDRDRKTKRRKPLDLSRHLTAL
ncbi:MAG: nitroreductase family protein [Leucobacter sp.]